VEEVLGYGEEKDDIVHLLQGVNNNYQPISVAFKYYSAKIL
jgi:hypothetical protein